MQINILEAIADALYSNSEPVIDAVADLIENLLERDADGANIARGISVAGSVMNNCLPPGMANQLMIAQRIAGESETSRIAILSELASAVGLQRFRFAERQSNGEAFPDFERRQTAGASRPSSDFFTVRLILARFDVGRRHCRLQMSGKNSREGFAGNAAFD